MVSFHDLGKLADVEHIAQTAHVKVVIIQMFQPCRKAAPIRVIHLYNSAIWNAVEVVIVAVDETNILRQRFRLPEMFIRDSYYDVLFTKLLAMLRKGLFHRLPSRRMFFVRQSPEIFHMFLDLSLIHILPHISST